MIKFSRKTLFDLLLTVAGLAAGGWAGAKIFNSSCWQCWNTAGDYPASPPELKMCLNTGGKQYSDNTNLKICICIFVIYKYKY